MAVTLTLGYHLQFLQRKVVEGANVDAEPRFDQNLTLESGTVVNEQDLLWYDIGRTLAASASENLDLAGSLSDPFGDTITMAKLKGIYIHNKNTTAGDVLQFGNNAAHVPLFSAVTTSFDIGPGATFFWLDPSLAGVTVTAGTGDIISLAETGAANTLTFDIAIWGTSA